MKPLEDMGRYKTVVIDPPWALPSIGWASKANGHLRNLPYATMGDAELGQLPIDACLEDDSLVFCWATNQRLLPAINMVGMWNTRYWFKQWFGTRMEVFNFRTLPLSMQNM